MLSFFLIGDDLSYDLEDILEIIDEAPEPVEIFPIEIGTVYFLDPRFDVYFLDPRFDVYFLGD